jgi:hypothetical protein
LFFRRPEVGLPHEKIGAVGRNVDLGERRFRASWCDYRGPCGRPRRGATRHTGMEVQGAASATPRNADSLPVRARVARTARRTPPWLQNVPGNYPERVAAEISWMVTLPTPGSLALASLSNPKHSRPVVCARLFAAAGPVTIGSQLISEVHAGSGVGRIWGRGLRCWVETQDILGFRCRLTLLTKLPTSLGGCCCTVRAQIDKRRQCECGEEGYIVGGGRAAPMPMAAATLASVPVEVSLFAEVFPY